MPDRPLAALSGLLIASLFALTYGGLDSGDLLGIYAGLLMAAVGIGSTAWHFQPFWRAHSVDRWRQSFHFAALFYVVALAIAAYHSPLVTVAAELALAMAVLSSGYWVVSACMRRGLEWIQVWKLLRAVGLVLATMAIIEKLLVGGRSYAILLDPNVLAAFFNVFLLTGFASLAKRLRQGERWRALIGELALFLLLAAAQGTTGSLSGLLCLLATLLPLSFFVMRGQPLRRAGSLLATAVAAVLLAVVCSGGNKETPTTKMQGIAQHSSFTVRLEMAEASLAIYRESAWYGSGLGTYKLHYPRHRGLLDTATTGDLAHNDYVQFLQEGGPLLLGALLLIALLVMGRSLQLLYLHWRKGPDNLALAQVGMGAALIALLLHAGMNFIFYTAPLALLFGVLLAGFAGAGEKRNPLPTSPGTSLIFMTLIGAMCIGLLSTVGARALFLSLVQSRCEIHLCQTLRSDVLFMKKLTTYLVSTQKTWLPAREHLITNNLNTESVFSDPAEKARWRASALRETLSVIEDVPSYGSAYVIVAGILEQDPSLAAQLPPGLPRDPMSLMRIALLHDPLNMPLRMRLINKLTEQSKHAEAYAELSQIMPRWNLYTLGDHGRMQLLITGISLNSALHQCREAKEMSQGLDVFIDLQKQSAEKGIELFQPSLGFTAPSAAEIDRAKTLAAGCV